MEENNKRVAKSDEKTYMPKNVIKHDDAILPRKGPFTRAMSNRLQEDWARAAEEGPKVLMNLRVDF